MYNHRVEYGKKYGDFKVDGKWIFEVGGANKTFEQIANIPNSYILADDSEITSKEAFKKAHEMMKGNKWRLFKLNFSFIGWLF